MEPISLTAFLLIVSTENVVAIVISALVAHCWREPTDIPISNLCLAKVLTGVMVLLTLALWLRFRFLQSTSQELRLTMLILALAANWMMYVPIVSWHKAIRILRTQARNSRKVDND